VSRAVGGVAGTTRLKGVPLDADALAEIVLPDQEGAEVRVGDLWARRPVALVWLRHYG
jgi:hypothetical protein